MVQVTYKFKQTKFTEIEKDLETSQSQSSYYQILKLTTQFVTSVQYVVTIYSKLLSVYTYLL